MEVKIEVHEKATGKLVYGNSGDRSVHGAMFDKDLTAYADVAKYTITEIDESAKKAARDANRNALPVLRNKVRDGSASLTDMRKVLAGMMSEELE